MSSSGRGVYPWMRTFWPYPSPLRSPKTERLDDCTPGNAVNSNAANSIGFAGRGLGGRGYRFTVVCTDNGAATHQQEVEFLVNFGF